ncbi:MAG: hypothetical protein HY922_07180 [Elusimicrobia bacterium]|nr:hypothetical protein [Elusimicrobiota bacterium]
MRTALLAAALLLGSAPASANVFTEARLWQERYFFDALLQSRDRAARVCADPALLDVVKTLAHQVAQQALNIEQIQAYAKAQIDNLKFAFAQQNPSASLAVIQNNFTTLSRGSEQIRNNLYYLTARARLSSSQALPDPKLTEMAALLIAQIQNVQLKLNTLYLDTVAVANAVRKETWYADDFFRYSTEDLLSAVVSVQDSVYSVYNASYELYVLSK